MKLLFVLEHYYPHVGGGETLFKLLTEKLVSEGHECHVVTCRLKGTKKFEKINGVHVHRVNVPHWKDRYWFTFFAIPTVLRLARKCDIIHTMTYNGALPARFASKLLEKPSVITVHEVLGDLWVNARIMTGPVGMVHRFFEEIIIFLNFSRFVAVSEYTKKSLVREGVSASKVSVVYNGVDYNFFDPKKVRKKALKRKEFTYLYFGRTGVVKGPEYLIKAVPKIRDMIPGSKLILITNLKEGRGKYIQSIIDDLDVKDSIINVSQVPRKELPSYLMSADCVVIPSLREGFGFNAAEACALGIPVVATRAGALPEVVSGKYIFIRPKNPEDIANAVLSVKNGKYRKTKLKKFTLEDFYKGYKEVYDSMI